MSGSTEVRARARKGWLVAVIAAAGLIAASCGDDSGGGSAASSGAPTSGGAAETSAPADTSAPATSAAAGEATTVTDFAAYVGGSGAADASLEPIKVGLLQPAGRRRSRSGRRNDDGVEIGGQVHQRAGRRHRWPPARGGELLHRDRPRKKASSAASSSPTTTPSSPSIEGPTSSERSRSTPRSATSRWSPVCR